MSNVPLHVALLALYGGGVPLASAVFYAFSWREMWLHCVTCLVAGALVLAGTLSGVPFFHVLATCFYLLETMFWLTGCAFLLSKKGYSPERVLLAAGLVFLHVPVLLAITCLALGVAP